MVELDARVVGGETPVDGADGGVTGGDPGRDLLFERLAVRQEAPQLLLTLAIGWLRPATARRSR